MAAPEAGRPIALVEPHYPALTFLARHGHKVAVAAGLLAFLASVWMARESDAGAGGMLIGAGIALAAYFIVRVMWDIARLLADTLIPR
ncbi:MAG: hypothetical protein JWN93_1944 [Hyphomicrobiales bacterium]|nr:hypothetical protein [Hyphomicrobiales bacterium]